jgi:hypothetical protein
MVAFAFGVPPEFKSYKVCNCRCSHVRKTFMRITFIIFLIIFYLAATGQKIEYRNDSLFIENIYVDAQTPKDELDKILNEPGKTRKSKNNFRKHPVTGKKVREKTIYYLNHGLYFRRYDYDTTKFSVGLRLYPYMVDKQEKVYGLPGRAFSGQLYIGENFINDKRTISELQTLKNCSVTLEEVVWGTYRTIIGGDIIYKQNIIRLSFDPQNKELTSVLIHHNFRDR